MIIELGVLYACLSGYCDKTGAAYYAQNPWFREHIEQTKDEVIHMMNPNFVRFTGPTLGAIFIQESTIDMGKNKSITINIKDGTKLNFIWGF